MKANQDIRDYMEDHGVTQKMLAAEVGVSLYYINRKLQTELSTSDKDVYLNLIDTIASKQLDEEQPASEDACTEETEQAADVSCSTAFQIGDRVKIPSKENKVATVSDIWHSVAKDSFMYAVDDENGHTGLYAEDQLEPAPIPIEYSFGAHIDGNVAVVTMTATQGEKSWIYARGHAHILHNGEVGLAQAVSYAARRMFETLDKKQENKIYFK